LSLPCCWLQPAHISLRIDIIRTKLIPSCRMINKMEDHTASVLPLIAITKDAGIIKTRDKLSFKMKMEDHIALEPPLIAITKDAGTTKTRDKLWFKIFQDAMVTLEKLQDRTAVSQVFINAKDIMNGQLAQKIEARKFMAQPARQETLIMSQLLLNNQHAKVDLVKSQEQIAPQEILIKILLTHKASQMMEDHIALELPSIATTRDAGIIKTKVRLWLKIFQDATEEQEKLLEKIAVFQDLPKIKMEDHIASVLPSIATTRDAGTTKTKDKLSFKMKMEILHTALVLSLILQTNHASGLQTQLLSNSQHAKELLEKS